MTKHLRLIINLLIICFLLAALALIIPPSAGVTTVIVDDKITDTNLGNGTVVYSHPVNSDRLNVGDQLLNYSNTSVYVSELTGKDKNTNQYVLKTENGKEKKVTAKETGEKVFVTVPLIGYISIATHSFEGRIILCLLFAALVVLYILSGILRSDDEEDEEDENEPVLTRRQRKAREKEIREQSLLELTNSEPSGDTNPDTSDLSKPEEERDNSPASESAQASDDENLNLTNTIQEALEKEIDKNFYVNKSEDDMREDTNMNKEKSVTSPKDLDIPAVNYDDIMEKPAVKDRNGISSEMKDTLSYREKPDTLVREKDLLCRQAAELVEDGDIIYIDSGTTCRNIVDYISDKNCTIITNSLRVTAKATEYPRINVISLPGKLKTDTLSLVGTDCLEYFRRYNIGKAFLSCSGISVKNGLTIAAVEEYLIKKAVIENSQENYLLADHTKFGKVSLMTYARLDQIQSIITDHVLPKEYQEQCDKNNIDLVIS